MAEGSEQTSEEGIRHAYEQIAWLAGGLAHEIRNPLSTICLNLEVIGEELRESDTPRDRRLLQRIAGIRRECGHLEDLLSEFLQFARGLNLQPVQTDLSALVEEFVRFQQPQATGQKVEISRHLASDLPKLELDESQFRCVLQNLTSNALQAMPSGGVLEFQTYLDGARVILEIIDNGCGMSAHTRDKMFELFYSTKSSGSGLGLPTVRKIVEAHGGRIECESEPGRGTRFRISLPCSGNSDPAGHDFQS